MDSNSGEIDISHDADTNSPEPPPEPPRPGQSIAPTSPQAPLQDLPEPHQPADYVPDTGPTVTTPSQPPAAAPLPDASQMFQPATPPGPAAIEAGPAVVVSGDGGIPVAANGPSPAQVSPNSPSLPHMSGQTMPGTTPPPAGGPPTGLKRILKKPVFLALILTVVLVGGASAYYFGYYTNPSVVLSQSLSDTGKGYTKLIDYFNQQSKVHYKGSQGKGSYSVKSGGTSTDGSFSFNSNGNNSDTNFDIGLGTTRVKAEIMTIKAANGNTPDIYLKASGIKGLGALTGSAQIDSAVNQYDGKWIVVDHTLLDNLGGSIASLASASGADTTNQPSGPNYPTEAQVMDELNAFGRVNQQYLFTTNSSKAVLTVVKRHGLETVNGHKTYHYTMGLNPAHVKQYLIAQHDALKASKLNDWLKQEGVESGIDQSFADAENSTKNIKSSDTFDLWADVSHRIVYKIRLADSGQNAATNYVDIGLDYKGGPSYPFFISGQSKSGGSTGTGSLVATLDSKSNSMELKGNINSTGSTPFSLNVDFAFTPSNNVPQISAPTGAVSLSQVLDQLGLSDLMNQLAAASPSVNAGIQSKAKDSKRQADLNAVQTQLEAYFTQNGNYPSLTDMNNPTWLQTNMSSLDTSALQDPDGTSTKLASKPAAKVYAYQPTTSTGASCEADDTQCAAYTLTATLSNGTTFVKKNLD